MTRINSKPGKYLSLRRKPDPGVSRISLPDRGTPIGGQKFDLGLDISGRAERMLTLGSQRAAHSKRIALHVRKS